MKSGQRRVARRALVGDSRLRATVQAWHYWPGRRAPMLLADRLRGICISIGKGQCGRNCRRCRDNPRAGCSVIMREGAEAVQALARVVALLAREGDAGDAAVLGARGEFGEAAPAAADLEHVLSGSQFEQRADVLVLPATAVSSVSASSMAAPRKSSCQDRARFRRTRCRVVMVGDVALAARPRVAPEPVAQGGRKRRDGLPSWVGRRALVGKRQVISPTDQVLSAPSIACRPRRSRSCRPAGGS